MWKVGQRMSATAMGRMAAARGLHATATQCAKYNSILDTVGRTPVVRINNIVSASDQ